MNNSPPHRQTKVYPSFFNLAAITLVLILGGIGLAYWLNTIKLSPKTTNLSSYNAPFVSKILAGTRLKIPQDWLIEPQHGTLEVNFLDLKLNIEFSTDAEPAPIGLHLAVQENTQPSARLLDSVYTLRFLPNEISGARGLIGKPLKPEDGFENETVWYDPISPTPFVAKCINLGPRDAEHLCLRSVQLGPTIILTYQFNADILTHWRKFDDVLEPFLTLITK